MRSRTVLVSLALTGAVLAVVGVSSPVRAATVTSGSCTSTVGNATNVTMSVDGSGLCVLQFKNVGSTTWTVPAGVTAADVLVVGGGGAGAWSDVIAQGGGGGGGVAQKSALAVSGTYTISVGAGGTGTNSPLTWTSGSSSSITNGTVTITADGGGAGAGWGGAVGFNGGSGGGGHWYNSGEDKGLATKGSFSGVTGVTLHGNDGGNSNLANSAGGGGGGASAAGTNGTAGQVGGNGGAGLTSSISGSAVVYGSGGSGIGTNGAGTAGTNAGVGSVNAQGGDGVANTGAGGGAAAYAFRSGHGGSGIVIVRFAMPSAPANSSLPTVSGTVRNGEIITGTQGTWTGYPAPTFTFKWRRASSASGAYSDIAGATSATYTLTDEDVGRYLKFEVTATNASGAVSQASAATVQVADYPDGTVPTLSSATSTSDGFTFTITNYSAGTTYTFLSASGTVSRTGSSVRVTGITAGQSATVTVRAAVSGFQTMSATVTGSALAAAVTTTTTPPALEIVVVAPTSTTSSVPAVASPVTLLPPVVVTPTRSSGTATTVAAAASTTTSTQPASSPVTTTVPVPRVGNVATGSAAAEIGGEAADATVQRIDNRLVVQAGPLNATIGAVDGSGGAGVLDSDGNVRLLPGDSVRINASGFEPGSVIDVWLFSSPVRLGSAEVGDDGTVTGTFTVPENAERGSHRIAIIARTVDGEPASLVVGVLVGDWEKSTNLATWLIVLPIVLAVGGALALPATRRRRRRNDTAA
ncbi:MAG: glycine-rich domain-containing protein [Ilumatobacteraceae bacterium]